MTSSLDFLHMNRFDIVQIYRQYCDIRSQNGFCHGNEDSGHVETQMAKSSRRALAELLIYVQSSLQMGNSIVYELSKLMSYLNLMLLGRTISCQNTASYNSSQSLPQPVSEGSGNHDFFYLVQQWQISLCNLRPCQKPARPTFSIYGFWPSCSSGIPNYKIGTIFDPSKILDLKNELDKEWPSLEEEENEEMWKKEWERHGICSEPLLTQHAFFETALKLKQTYDLFNILANRAILPFGEVYGLENISDAIKGSTGHTPQVECESYKHIPLLSKIFLCFHYTATSIHIIDCPLITRCKFQAILFPYDLF